MDIDHELSSYPMEFEPDLADEDTQEAETWDSQACTIASSQDSPSPTPTSASPPTAAVPTYTFNTILTAAVLPPPPSSSRFLKSYTTFNASAEKMFSGDWCYFVPPTQRSLLSDEDRITHFITAVMENVYVSPTAISHYLLAQIITNSADDQTLVITDGHQRITRVYILVLYFVYLVQKEIRHAPSAMLKTLYRDLLDMVYTSDGLRRYTSHSDGVNQFVASLCPPQATDLDLWPATPCPQMDAYAASFFWASDPLNKKAIVATQGLEVGLYANMLLVFRNTLFTAITPAAIVYVASTLFTAVEFGVVQYNNQSQTYMTKLYNNFNTGTAAMTNMDRVAMTCAKFASYDDLSLFSETLRKCMLELDTCPLVDSSVSNFDHYLRLFISIACSAPKQPKTNPKDKVKDMTYVDRVCLHIADAVKPMDLVSQLYNSMQAFNIIVCGKAPEEHGLRLEIAVALRLLNFRLWTVPVAIMALWVEKSIDTQSAVLEIKRFCLLVAYMTLSGVPLGTQVALATKGAAVLTDADVEVINMDGYWRVFQDAKVVSIDFRRWITRTLFNKALDEDTNRVRSTLNGRRDAALFYLGRYAGLFFLQHEGGRNDPKLFTLPATATGLLSNPVRQEYLTLPKHHRFHHIPLKKALATMGGSGMHRVLLSDLRNPYMYKHDPRWELDTKDMHKYMRRKRMTTVKTLLPVFFLTLGDLAHDARAPPQGNVSTYMYSVETGLYEGDFEDSPATK